MTEQLFEGDYVPSTDPETQEQVELYERTNGTDGATLHGGPVVILTMRGARSGKIRKVALMKIERDGTYALGAANNGAAGNPSWYHNLIAHPVVQLQDGATRRTMTARLIEGDEKASWIAYADQLYPFFPGLRTRAADTGNREIPLMLLEPADD